MDKIYNILAVMGLAVGLTACNDIVDLGDRTDNSQIENHGAPVITAVYKIGEDADLTAPVSRRDVGQMVRIEGQNLNFAKSIRFNTVEADLSEAYTFSIGANVAIPTQESYLRENTLVYTTEQGTTSVPFVVDCPDPNLSMKNAFAMPGSTVTILGKNLKAYNFNNYFGAQSYSGSITLNSDNLQIVDYTSDSIKVQMPASAENATIDIAYTTTQGEEKTSTQHYRQTSQLLFVNYDGASVYNNDGSLVPTVVEDGADGTPSTGYKAVHVKGSTDAWGWNTVLIEQNFGLATIIDPTQYELRFEILTREASPLIADSEDFPLFQFRIGWNEPQQALRSIGNTHGQWQTVSVPLTKIGMSGSSTKLIKNQWTTWYMLLKPIAAWDADFYMSNFRLEKTGSSESGDTESVPTGTEQKGGTDASHITPAGAKISR